ncbi:MAG: response regulator [Verrucomicrobiota bacterium]
MSRPVPPLHILVVDDEAIVREALKMILIFKGHTVDLASDGPEALGKMAKQTFDIVFTDYNMPEMLGDELAKRTRQRYPHQVIVMISAYSKFLSRDQIPVDLFIAKPFELQTVLDAVGRAHKINKANRKKAECQFPPSATPPL